MEETICLICRDPLIDDENELGYFIKLRCGHMYHQECILSSIKVLTKVCPYCSSKFRTLSRKKFKSVKRKEVSYCTSSTSTGNTCKNKKMNNSDYCWIHQKKLPKSEESPVMATSNIINV